MQVRAQFSKAIFFLLPQIGLVLGIILDRVTIPPYGVKNGTVELGCEFTLGSDTLLVLQWYKAEHEFFRYTPERDIQTFPVPGVFVDLSKSSQHKVVLRNIALQTSGVYSVSVTVESSFKTLSKQGHMVIIAPPTPSDPLITGVHSAVNLGDRVIGNCTSYRSKPSAALTIYINDEKVEMPEVRRYPTLREPDGLETSILGFSFLVEARHFHNRNLRLKCTATIGNFYWVKTLNISDANIKAQLSYPGHNRLSSGSQKPSPFAFFNAVSCWFFIRLIIVSRLY